MVFNLHMSIMGVTHLGKSNIERIAKRPCLTRTQTIVKVLTECLSRRCALGAYCWAPGAHNVLAKSRVAILRGRSIWFCGMVDALRHGQSAASVVCVSRLDGSPEFHGARQMAIGICYLIGVEGRMLYAQSMLSSLVSRNRCLHSQL